MEIARDRAGGNDRDSEHLMEIARDRRLEAMFGILNRRFPTRMVYLYYISCLRDTILVGNPRKVEIANKTMRISEIV